MDSPATSSLPPPPPNRYNFRKPKPLNNQPIALKPQRTNPIIWFLGVTCLFFTLFLIFFGITTLIIFVSLISRTPLFDTPGATLNFIYSNSNEFINGDFTFLANVSNPNKKIDVTFEYSKVELYFSEFLVATQGIQPFVEKPRKTETFLVHMIASLAYLPPNVALEFQKQMQRKRVVFDLVATFRVKVNLGIMHFRYWLHGRCQLEVTSPPNGFLLHHDCRTKR
ncbi:hypothetical protein LIER_41262 [Lithospermum erythrorhizon]|uniref:Late embryogenesis abundant protein LEA-2 subgroup domain-containing protein n=1 Tax=Lithospermum erythrorhizon TaxID=34254 RepID=A0AAV3R6K0_LITER